VTGIAADAPSEPGIPTVAAAPEGGRRRSAALAGLLFLGVLYTLYFARALIIPIVLAVLLDFLLKPLVRTLRRVGVPEAAGAAIVVLGSVGAVGVAAYQLADPAREWLASAPATLRQATDRLRPVRRPLEGLNRTAQQVRQVTREANDTTTREVAVKGPPLSAKLLGSAQAFITSAFEVAILLYFLLASGDLFLQKLIKLLPQLSDKKTAVAIAREMETAISTYLVTVTLINVGVALAVAGALSLVGLPSPLLWGTLAGLAEFIPYMGATVMVVLLSIAGLATFDHLGHALLVPGAYLAVNFVQANVVSPLLHGRRLALNPVAIFLGLLLCWWMWGVLGAFLAVPLLAMVKIFCDHLERLAPVGEFLAR
jgi:predicted PurR-regulated permease PerM